MKLLIFAPCEKVILDKAGNPSLISIMQNVHITVPDGETVPDNAVSPKEWFVFTHWLASDEDMGVTLSQKTQVILPDGKVFGDPPVTSSASFKVDDPEKRIIQNLVTLLGFPVGREGPISVRAWIEDEGGKAITDVLNYPLKVIYERGRVKI